MCSVYFNSPGPPGFLYRVVCVVHDVEKYLLKLVNVADDRRKILFELFDHFDAVVRKIVGPKFKGLPEHGVDLQRLALLGFLPRKA